MGNGIYGILKPPVVGPITFLLTFTIIGQIKDKGKVVPMLN
jgi:hypothetical protein